MKDVARTERDNMASRIKTQRRELKRLNKLVENRNQRPLHVQLREVRAENARLKARVIDADVTINQLQETSVKNVVELEPGQVYRVVRR